MVETSINGRWKLLLPEHRAARDSWPWWEATRLAAMRDQIEPGHVVWDAGAEEGDFPALFATWGAQLVLAEPNPRVWPNIKAIWDANGLGDPLLCWPGFFADRIEGEREPAVESEVWPDCAYGDVIGDHGFCQLGERPDRPLTTIDELVADGVPAPDVITMDVEGSELFVLRGAAETLRRHRPVVFVSVHPEFMAHHYGIEDGLGAVRCFMDEAGYDFAYLCTDHEVHEMYRPR